MWIKILLSTFFISTSINCDTDFYRESKFLQSHHFTSTTDDINFPTYRLPNDSIPLKYEITLRTDIHEGKFEFTGNVRIQIKIVEPTNVITLKYRQITITQVEMFSQDGLLLSSNVPFELIESREFLRILSPQNLFTDQIYSFRIIYNGLIRDAGLGIFRGNYNDDDGNVHWYATTQFEIDEARHAMPCYDEPGIRAPMQLTLIHGPPPYHAVSNTPVLQTGPFGTGYHRTIFEETPSIQTYLLAFLVSDFKHVTYNGTRVQQKVYAKPSSIDKGEGDFAITIMGPILDKHEENLGVNYPLDKMDHVAIREFIFGAMENIGMMNYIDTALLFDPKTPPSQQEERKMRIIRVAAHEFAHQYAGNIVSPKWWSYTWLNEGIATLYDVYIPSLLYPEFNFAERFVTINMPRAFAADSLATSWSMNHYTEIPAELWNKFNNIGYEKSACILRMFQGAMTIPTFTKGLNNYFTKMYMKAAVPQDLYESLQWAYDEDFPGNSLDIGKLMDMWASQPGYPLLSIEKFNDRLLLTQKRHVLSNGEIYAIPLTYATKTDKNFESKTPKVWMTSQSIVLREQVNEWIIFNNQQNGYYRVDYSTELWHPIIKQLIENHEEIHEINRAVLQDETYLAWRELNRLDVNDVFNVLSYLSKEEYHVTWMKASNALNLIYSRLLGTELFQNYHKFLVHISKSHLAKHGLDYVDFELSSITSLRNSARHWNCEGLNAQCLDNEQKKFMEYFNTPSNSYSISFDYCHAMRNIEPEIFNQLILHVSTNSSNRNNYLSGMGCSLNGENLRKFLEISINSSNTLNVNERKSVIENTCYKSSLALELTIQFIINNYDAIDNIIPDQIHSILQTVASQINTLELADKFEEILSDSSRENAQIVRNFYIENLKWHAENFQLISNWFDEWNENNDKNIESGASSIISSILIIAIGGLINIFI